MRGSLAYFIVLVIYCCVTNHSKTWCLKTRDIYYLTVSVGQKFGSSLAVWSALGSPMKLLSGCQPGCSLMKAWVGLDNLLLKWLTRMMWVNASVLCQADLSKQHLKRKPLWRGSQFPPVQVIHDREQGESHDAFYNLVTLCHFCQAFWWKLLSIATVKEKEIRLHILKGEEYQTGVTDQVEVSSARDSEYLLIVASWSSSLNC